MKDYIDVDAAGMFSPQEEGPCKLTVIINDREDQAFAFSKLRYTKIRIGLIPSDDEVETSDSLKEIEDDERALERMLRRVREAKAAIIEGENAEELADAYPFFGNADMKAIADTVQIQEDPAHAD